MLINRKFSLRFLLTIFFAVLVLCIGGLLAALNYHQNTKLLLSAADEIYDRASESVVLNFRKTYNPVRNSLELLSHSSISESSTFNQRLKYISSLSAALYTEDAISAIQFGYENGDYFIVRKLDTQALVNSFKAPNKAILMVDNISKNKADEALLSRVFLDKHLHILQRDEIISTNYDPRTRLWFIQARKTPHTINPYYFYFMKKVGTTISMKMQHSKTIIATDIVLENISTGLRKTKITEMSELYLITSSGSVLASSNESESLIKNIEGSVVLKKLEELTSQIAKNFINKFNLQNQELIINVEGVYWQGSVKEIGKLGEDKLYLLMFTPIKELIKDAIKIALNSFYVLLIIIVLTIPVVWWISKRISAALHQLAIESQDIMNFNFDQSKSTVSYIKEVDDLAQSQALMKASLSQFMALINSLAYEKNFDSLLDKITIETLQASKADAVATYLVDDNSEVLNPHVLKLKQDSGSGCDFLPVFSLTEKNEISKIINSSDCHCLFQKANQNNHWSALSEKMHDENLSLIILPLRNRQSEFMGMMVLVYKQVNPQTNNNQQQTLAFVQAFSEFSAVSLESKYLLKMQEDLLDAFIKLIAGAIDAKSPYTGGHCQRVPEITKMLAQAACESNADIFSDYQLNEDQWKEIHIASWLHDCGKVTTPEYVVDKSTKLETIYDRIHEIRMRFEVLKRDAEINYLKTLKDGGDEALLKKEFTETIKKLNDDFEFVATCNQGGEFMEDEKILRLNEISELRWMRTLDKTAGISWEEKKRMETNIQPVLPVEEKLLADNIEHIIHREEIDLIPKDNKWNFKMSVPEYKFNRGELYNLSIKRGTLSEEERFVINGHMIQTIKMLEELPYPSHLKNVPIIAGCHHESMDGKGYPKRLSKEDMPLTARMMAIADIFEALTASDRPYKKAKTLTESLRIMATMCKNNHIDADLFNLFLSSGVYLKYANQYLNAEQIDDVDITQYLFTAI